MRFLRAHSERSDQTAGRAHSVARLLLSHHPPEHAHRTITVGCGPWRVRLCARCLGLTAGFLLSWSLLAGGVAGRMPLWLTVSWLLLAPWPALLDFHGQLMGLWESTNARRLATGAMFGAGLGLGLEQALQGQWALAALVPAAFGIYLSWATTGRRRAARLRRHLRLYAAYYERCQAEDARWAVSGHTTRNERSKTPA